MNSCFSERVSLEYVLIQEFNIEKLQLVEAEKKKLRQEYERKAKQVEVKKKMWAFNSSSYSSFAVKFYNFWVTLLKKWSAESTRCNWTRLA